MSSIQVISSQLLEFGVSEALGLELWDQNAKRETTAQDRRQYMSQWKSQGQSTWKKNQLTSFSPVFKTHSATENSAAFLIRSPLRTRFYLITIFHWIKYGKKQIKANSGVSQPSTIIVRILFSHMLDWKWQKIPAASSPVPWFSSSVPYSHVHIFSERYMKKMTFEKPIPIIPWIPNLLSFLGVGTKAFTFPSVSHYTE